MGNLTTIGWDWCTPYYGMCDLYAWFFEGQNCVEMCIYLHKNLYMGSARPVKYGWLGGQFNFNSRVTHTTMEIENENNKVYMVYKHHGV